MRFFMAASACAVSVALLAGCSSMQGASSVPSSTQVGQSVVKYTPPHHKLSFAQILQLQIAGKMVPQAPIKALKQMLKRAQGDHSQLHAKPLSGSVGVWATEEEYGYLLGLNKGENKAVAAIDLEDNGCYYPTTVKVDHSGNVWNSCEYNDTFEAGQAQEYSSAGSLKADYSATCPGSGTCEYSDSYSYDQAENSSDVFVGLPFIEYDYCVTTDDCTSYDGSGIEYWPAGESSERPTFIPVAGFTISGAPDTDVFDMTYFDVDSSNIYFVYYGDDETTDAEGYGLAEVENYATSPTIVPLLAPGSIGFGGGVWVGGQGSFLAVLDQDARTVSKYALPFNGSPEDVYGPTRQNVEGLGDPISGGFNSSDTQYTAGDGYGWMDKLKLDAGKAKLTANADCSEGCYGASYDPSDK